MSGTFPSNKVRALNFKNNHPNIVTTSLSGRRQVKSQGQQFFSFTIQTPILSIADYNEVMGFLASQRGQFDQFSVNLPHLSDPAGSITSNTLAVNEPSGADAGATSIAVDGGVASATGYMKKGDFIRFISTGTTANNTKVYVLTADLDLDGTGAGTLNIEPGLIDSVNNDSTVETNNVTFTVYQTGATQEYDVGVEGFAQVEIDVAESIGSVT